jgi:hypothetical protein
MKKNKSGFILVETLIVSVFIVTTLIFLYVQFQKIETSYSTTFKYNTTDNLYKVYNIRKYLLEGLNIGSNYQNVVSTFLSSDDQYLNLTSCPSTVISDNRDYCLSLFQKLDIKTVLFTREDLTDLKADLNNLYFISEDLKAFIRYIDFDGNVAEYRLIVEFNDGTFASLKIYEGI